MPVNILYSTDTTGGNSGSPVFNAAGEVVGLNFDRAWEATINDFAWDHSYSRSIGVDIRYVLWVTWKHRRGRPSAGRDGRRSLIADPARFSPGPAGGRR